MTIAEGLPGGVVRDVLGGTPQSGLDGWAQCAHTMTPCPVASMLRWTTADPAR